jgi:glycosyltransferase involved in cell wall biosynthesis
VSKPLKIIWLGGVFRHSAIEASSAIAPAANLWQRRVIDTLRNAGHTVTTLAHYPDRVFPYGPLLPGKEEDFDPAYRGAFVSHLNLPRLRSACLIYSYKRSFKRLLEAEGRPDCVLSYNPMPWNSTLGRWAQSTYRIPWISLNLDFDSPGPRWEKFLRAAEGARGQVFLSWYAYKNCPIGPKFHFDALANFSAKRWELTEEKTSRKGQGRSIVYSGSFNQWTGIHDLVEAFCLLDPQDVWLDLCGHSIAVQSDELIQRHPRIRFHGLLSEVDLERLCAGADILVNPRPARVAGNEMNFPSKLMEYLSYGLPVVSTRTPGVAPIYNELILESEEGPAGIAEGLRRGLAMPKAQRLLQRQRIKKFLMNEREPARMVDGLVEWLRTCLCVGTSAT